MCVCVGGGGDEMRGGQEARAPFRQMHDPFTPLSCPPTHPAAVAAAW